MADDQHGAGPAFRRSCKTGFRMSNDLTMHATTIVTVRKGGTTSGPVQVELLVLQNAGEVGERYLRVKVDFPAEAGVKTFTFQDGAIQ